MRVTHPFHPLAGQEFEFVKRRKNWQADRVYFYDGGAVLLVLPAEWTDAVAADPFVVVSAGRSPFHVDGLLELSGLVAGLAVLRPARARRLAKRTMPQLSSELCASLRCWWPGILWLYRGFHTGISCSSCARCRAR